MQGDYVWIEPTSKREFDVAIGARVVSAEGKRIQVVDDDGKVHISILQSLLGLTVAVTCLIWIY